MKKSLTLWSLLCLIATPLVSIAQTGTNNRLLFTTDLNGGQEVPAVATDARGIATILISEDRTTMSVHAVFSGLSGSVTGCHIHTGGEGVAGPVFVNFSNNVTGNRLRAEIPIPADFMSRALKNELYLNVHTALNPSGEIRGQLGLKTENLYAIVLSGANETPPVTSTASGVGYLAHSPGNFFMRYVIEYNGLIRAFDGGAFSQWRSWSCRARRCGFIGWRNQYVNRNIRPDLASDRFFAKIG